jgi:hypothetical protein
MKTLVSELSRAAWLRAAVGLLAGLLVFSLAMPAYAAGRIVWKQTTLEERTANGSWTLEMEIHLARAPDIAHVGMTFAFTQKSQFERSLVDGREGPQLTTQPLSNQQPLIESQTVGFLDPGTGKTQTRTRFSFKVTRGHGYQAGEWSVKVTNSDTGEQIGQVANLRFNGENELVDRRSIVFQGKEKEEKPEEAPTENQSAAPPEEEMYMGEPDSEFEGNEPPSEQGRPGGGCHYVPHSGESLWFLLGLAIGAGVLMRRRS